MNLYAYVMNTPSMLVDPWGTTVVMEDHEVRVTDTATNYLGIAYVGEGLVEDPPLPAGWCCAWWDEFVLERCPRPGEGCFFAPGVRAHWTRWSPWREYAEPFVQHDLRWTLHSVVRHRFRKRFCDTFGRKLVEYRCYRGAGKKRETKGVQYILKYKCVWEWKEKHYEYGTITLRPI